MKLNKEDKELLKDWGYLDEDINQIERATRKTTYEAKCGRISANKALEKLGREEYLSGIARSAFHWSSARTTEDGETILFDSSKLFE